MATIGELTVSLRADIKQYVDELEKAKGKSHETEDVVKNGLGVALGIGLAKAADFAVDKLKELVGVMVDAFNEAQATELINVKLEQALRNTGYQVVANYEAADALAQKYRDLAGGEDDTVKSAETVLLRFKAISKDVFPDALKVSADLAAAMGTDMSSAALALGRAMESPQTGMRGLKMAGVDFNTEELKVLQNLVDTGRGAEAQRIIMATLAGTVGGMAAAAANTMAGRWEIMNNHLADAAKGIAEKLLPIMERLFDQVIKPAIPIVEQIADVFGTYLAAGINHVIDIFNFFGQIFAQGNNNMLVGTSTTYTTLLNIAATVGTMLMQLWNDSFFVKMMQQIFGVNLKFQGGFQETFYYIRDWINTVFGIIIPWRVGQVIDAIKGFPESVRRWFTQAGEDINKWLIKAWDDIRKFFSWENLQQIGQNIVKGLSDGITSAYYWLVNAIAYVGNLALNAFKRMFGIASPSSVFHGYGVNLMQGLAAGITSGVNMPQVALNAVGLNVGGAGGRGSTTNNYNYNYIARYDRPPTNEPAQSFSMLSSFVSQ